MFHLFHLVDHLDPLLRRYGYGFVALSTFGEAFGLPLPGESAVIAAGLLCRRGDMSLPVLIGVVSVASFLGDNVGYAIGRFGGRPLVLRLGRYVGATPERLDRVERVFRRYGAAMIVGARFVVLLRQLNGLVAGVANLSWPRFALANAAGAVLWATAWSVGPYVLAGTLRRAL